MCVCVCVCVCVCARARVCVCKLHIPSCYLWVQGLTEHMFQALSVQETRLENVLLQLLSCSLFPQSSYDCMRLMNYCLKKNCVHHQKY